MRNNNPIFISMLLGLLSLSLSQVALADVVVITNKSTSVDALSAEQVKALFLQKEKTLPGGGAVELGDQPNDSPAYREFAKKVLGKSPKKLKRYWSKRVFAGKGIPPKVVGNDAAMKEWVSKTPNSLGYIDAGAVDDSVKVIFKP